MARGISNGQSEKQIQFRVDRPLGKLVKWLRILGYDAISDSLPENKNIACASRYDDRIWITDTKPMAAIEGIIQIDTHNPIDQLRQVIKTLGIKRHSLKPFTRCSECNCELIRVDRETLQGQIPDFIWQTHHQFRTCDFCQKIFWPGSHVDKQRQIIEQLFE